jgi:hypothetical protein
MRAPLKRDQFRIEHDRIDPTQIDRPQLMLLLDQIDV